MLKHCGGFGNMRMAVNFLVLVTFWFPNYSCASWVDDPLSHQIQIQAAAEKNIPLPVILNSSDNAVQNGEFTDGLAFWSVSGVVQFVANQAELTDLPGPNTMLHQVVGLAPGPYDVSFDVRSDLSSRFAQGTFPDTFFASLYFIQQSGDLDIPGGVFDAVNPLMDMDWQGVFNNNGWIGPSALGPEWLHFRGSFQMTHAFVAIAFELDELNDTGGDSAVYIDNVVIALVPEPGALALMLSGGLFFFCRRRFL
jgi:hypothetical protein